MNLSRKSLVVIAALAVVAAAVPAHAQSRPVEHRTVPYALASGTHDNMAEAGVVVFDRVVSIADAPWVRLAFNRVELDGASYLRLTSLLDGAEQTLRPIHLLQWRNTSAYFNGPDVRVELIAAPGTRRNLVEINHVYAGVLSNDPESQCGPTDDRVASAEPARARLLDIGCTASIYHENSCFITAGHCTTPLSLLDVVEFQVPLSNGNGSLNHPGPQDQYVIDTTSVTAVNGGVGNDWGLFRVFPNAVTGLMPFEAQGARVNLASANPPVGDQVRIVGYGVDSGTANQTQQVSFGPITSSTATTLMYQSDTEGGNSGSCVEHVPTGDIVAIHTHGGCSTGGGAGANSGTQITNAGLQAALVGFCGTTGGIPCEDIQSSVARCRATAQGNQLQMQVVLTDTSHDGETVTFRVDGADRVATVVGNRARAAVNGASAGAHVIELVNPSGCVPARTVLCQ